MASALRPPERIVEALDAYEGASKPSDEGGMRNGECNKLRMGRALHARWPFRRSHVRHDLHWLVQVRPQRISCRRGRIHTVETLRACRPLRPHNE